MKAVKIKSDSVIQSGTHDGCVTLNGDKRRSPLITYQSPIFNFMVYDNGSPVKLVRTRKSAIRLCDEHVKPNSAAYIRTANKLVYFHEHNHEPVFFRGFETKSWKNKAHGRALVDYENHTPKEVTERYDAIAYALEQMAQKQNDTHTA